MNKKDMNSQFHLRQLKQTAISMLLLFAGCADKMELPLPGGGNTELPDGRVAYTLHTAAPQFERPVTRTGTADEDNATGDMWVFAFDASTTDTLFLEAAKASDHEPAGTGASKRTVILKSRPGKVTLLVLDNAPATIHNGTTDPSITDPASWGLTTATTLAQARIRLNTVRLATPSVSTVPYTPTLKIPLSAEINRDKLDASTEFGTEAVPLGLKRVVACLTVKKDFRTVAGYTPPAFALKGATVYNAPRNASLFPAHKTNSGSTDRTNYIGSTGNEITGIAAATGDDTADNPIYLYPSAEATAANQPFVLIQADYNNDGYDTYYKLAIAPEGKPVGRVERNTAYRLLIKSCTGRGYLTIAEAAAAPPSNVITYNIEVTDLTSHDIQDNGQYFLAFSNSEFHLYVTGTATAVPVTTLSFGYTTGVVGSVKITDVVGTAPTFSSPVSFSEANKTSQDIRMTFPAAFRSCTLEVRYGNLVNRIPITRYNTLPSAMILQKMYATASANFTNGMVEFPAGTDPWVSLTTDPNPNYFAPGGHSIALNEKGKVYLRLQSNVETYNSDGSVAVSAVNRFASLYLSRPSDKGRLKVYMMQDALNMSTLDDTNPADPGFVPVVAAYWRAEQTGERLVQITKNNNPTAPSISGYWYTTNVFYGSNWDPDNGDGVRVDNLPSKDPFIWNSDNSKMANGNDADFDTKYTVSESRYAEGEVSADANGVIYYRIGLEKPYTPTPEAPARYAMIVMSYTSTNTTGTVSEMKQRRLFLRQGHDADYLMRPTDPYGNYGQTLAYWTTPSPFISLWDWAKGPVWRPYAKKFLPYNLRATNWNNTTESLPLRKDESTFNKNKLTDYPSQGGYHFRFSGVEGSAQQVAASLQTQPLGVWDASKSETCPVGYRRFEDGVSTTTRIYSRALADNSELRQSLWLSPGFGNARNSESGINSIKGYYADGYFDRRKIVNAGTMSTKSAVAYNTSQVAYQGYLMFNPNNYASLFFPLAGRRGMNFGTSLELAGGYGIYWSSTVTNSSTPADGVTNATGGEVLGNEPFTINIGISGTGTTGYGNTTGVPGVTSWNYTRSGSIRCVKDE